VTGGWALDAGIIKDACFLKRAIDVEFGERFLVICSQGSIHHVYVFCD
jgi:hypothetical protein